VLREIFDLDGSERERALDRMLAWVALGSESAADLPRCLALLPELAMRAARRNEGLVSVNVRY
jgi:hypothetical protein